MADFNSFFKMTTVRDVKIAHPQWAVTWIHYTKLIRTRFQYADPDTMEVIYTLADAIEAEGQVLQIWLCVSRTQINMKFWQDISEPRLVKY